MRGGGNANTRSRIGGVTMGLERTVPIPAGADLSWARLVARVPGARLMMIDGLPAFPDEEPPLDWKELRVGTPAGMVTLRRAAEAVTVVVWENADEALRRTADDMART